jgi:lipoate-protein ligase A
LVSVTPLKKPCELISLRVQTPLRFLDLRGFSIFQQLQIEEALLRCDQDNWCLVNSGVSPAIILGISGKIDQLVNPEAMKASPLPLIRRFSGGGTVVVDENTLFVTFLCQNASLPVLPYPEKIMRWTEKIYSPLFQEMGFHLVENDYCLHDRKCGGNAQYITKDRCLHHSSFLWDFKKSRMDYLQLPSRRPDYRENRKHEDFLCCLKDVFPSKDLFIESLRERLAKVFIFEEAKAKDIESICLKEHRKATKKLL